MIYQTHGASCGHSILHMPHHANFVKLQDISGVSFQNNSILTTHIIFLLQAMLQCNNGNFYPPSHQFQNKRSENLMGGHNSWSPWSKNYVQFNQNKNSCIHRL